MRRLRLSRRDFVRAGLQACAGATALPAISALSSSTTAARTPGAPAIVQAESSRPAIAQGVASGDVTAGRAVIWSRTDRPARMVVEYSTTEKFEQVQQRIGPAALEPTDFTSRLVLTDLPPGQRIFYRVRFQDLGDLRAFSAIEGGQLPHARPRGAAARRHAGVVGRHRRPGLGHQS